jgi:hypothetical protein
MAGGNQPDPDEIERRLRELSQEVGQPRVHEPPARERLEAAKAPQQKAKRKRNRGVLTALAVVFVLLAGGGVYTWLRVAPPSWVHASGRATASAPATPKVRPTTATVSPVTSNGPPADPFTGSPADGWADGTAGIAIPAARAHGQYTTAQVRAAYTMTRKLLTAGNLDWPVLRGGAPTAFANLLTKQERKVFLAGLHTTALDKDGSEKNTRTWVTSFAPGSTQFVTTVVKVHGTMSAGTARNSGIEVLRIKVDYLFVFAVEPPGKPADWMRVVQQQFGYVDFAQWDDPGGALEPLVSLGSGTAGVQCDARDGYIHPDFPQGPPDSVQASGAPEDPYSLATPSESSGSSCHNATRT